MKYSISLNLLFACLISGSVQAGPFDRFRKSPEKQLIKAFKNENVQKAIELLQQHSHLAQLQNKDGWNLAHYAVASLNTSLLGLADRHGVDMLQENVDGRLPIELLAQTFMNSCCNDGCDHRDHTATLPQNTVLAGSLQSSFGLATSSTPAFCRRAKAQHTLESCRAIFLAQQNADLNKHIDRHNRYLVSLELFKPAGDIPIDLQKLIFTMTPTKHQKLCHKWNDSPAAFLKSCPTPALYPVTHGDEDHPRQEWYTQILK